MAEKTIKQLEEEIKTLTAKHKEEVEALKKENTEALEEIKTLNSILDVDEKREFIKTAAIGIFSSNINDTPHNVVEYSKMLANELFNNLDAE